MPGIRRRTHTLKAVPSSEEVLPPAGEDAPVEAAAEPEPQPEPAEPELESKPEPEPAPAKKTKTTSRKAPTRRKKKKTKQAGAPSDEDYATAGKLLGRAAAEKKSVDELLAEFQELIDHHQGLLDAYARVTNER